MPLPLTFYNKDLGALPHAKYLKVSSHLGPLFLFISEAAILVYTHCFKFYPLVRVNASYKQLVNKIGLTTS